MSEAQRGTAHWNIAAALAGWLLPGLGHILLGERRRGGIVAVTILLVWLTGLLVGGVSVIDHVKQSKWFAGQMLLAPSVLVDQYHQSLRRQVGGEPRPAGPGAPAAPYEPSYGMPADRGTLLTTLAGLLNLLTIFDVIYRRPDAAGESAPAGEPGANQAGEAS